MKSGSPDTPSAAALQHAVREVFLRLVGRQRQGPGEQFGLGVLHDDPAHARDQEHRRVVAGVTGDHHSSALIPSSSISQRNELPLLAIFGSTSRSRALE